MDDQPPPAPEEGAPPPAEEPAPAASPRPSKSTLVDKRVSTIDKTQSHVRVVEPGQEAKSPEEAPTDHGKSEPEKPSEPERKKSEASERKKSETTKSREMSVSVSQRGSKGTQRGSASQDGILRRQSDRPSKAKAIVGSTISIRKQSGYGEYFGGVKTPKFMNTYKLDSDNPFMVEPVEKILRDVLTEALENLTYDPDKCPKQAKWATSAIRARVKEKEYDRYKLIIIVTIGEKRYQDMCSVARFLWDIERDKYALFVHENMYVYAAAMCFGVYYE